MIVYKITNLVNGKIYVGQTTQSLSRRWNKHVNDKGCVALHNAIKFYGVSNFSMEVLEETDNLEQLNKLEISYIEKYDCISPKGYNLRVGGENRKMADETKEKLRKANIGKKQSKETIEKRIAKMVGKKHTEKAKQNMKIAQRGLNAKLTLGQVKLIKYLLKNKIKSTVIAKSLNVSVWSVYKIKSGNTWPYVEI